MLLVLRHIQWYFSYVATGYSYPLSGHPIRCKLGLFRVESTPTREPSRQRARFYRWCTRAGTRTHITMSSEYFSTILLLIIVASPGPISTSVFISPWPVNKFKYSINNTPANASRAYPDWSTNQLSLISILLYLVVNFELRFMLALFFEYMMRNETNFSDETMGRWEEWTPKHGLREWWLIWTRRSFWLLNPHQRCS